MGLETATFVSGLTPTWPTSGELKSQGDDHLRLIKQTLQNTLPTASKAFYFPTAEVISGLQTLDATDQNNTQLVDTTAGNIAVTLPSTLVAADKGWSIDIIKTSNDQNAVIVSPASGTISSKCGATATIRVGILCEPATFRWTGTGWICSKPGPMIGSTENFDGATVPPGYLIDNGGTFSNTAFAELFAVLGSSTLLDKRGRYELGIDTGGVNMPATSFGVAPGLGSTKVGSTITLGTTNLPAYTPAGGVTPTATVAGSAPWAFGGNPGSALVLGGASGGSAVAVPLAGALGAFGISTPFVGTAQGGLSTPIPVVPPSIAVNKIKRAC